jgi:hypothetical protein
MSWTVDFYNDFVPEFKALPIDVQDELLASVELLEKLGPELKRPQADTLNGSKYANMKELRFKAVGGVWRFAYAFDPQRQGIVLVGGDKSGSSERRFYKQLIQKADKRFETHLETLKKEL